MKTNRRRSIAISTIRMAAAVALALTAIGCGRASWQRAPHDTLFQHAPVPRLHEEVFEPAHSDWWAFMSSATTVQASRLVSPGWHLTRRKKRVGRPGAEDVNDFGKVPDSTWFENRLGRRTLTAAQVARGPNRIAEPPTGKLVVKSAKTEGATPGFIVKDEAGIGWVVKFDPPKYPEISTSSESICARLLWAAGYHVPENYVGTLRREQFVLAPDANTRDYYRRKVPLTQAELDATLKKVFPKGKSTVRVTYSRFLEGKPVGNFPYFGTREDDPNDHIPHERRRSLRGLWAFYAWINNTDAKPTNNLDTFIEVDAERGLGYVKHHLIDFGSALGGSPNGPKALTGGYKYGLDLDELVTRYVMLGGHHPYWVELEKQPLYDKVGNLEWEVFRPERWRPSYPNVLFDAADPHDTFWAASILAHYTPAHIEAAVGAGHYSDPRASLWVATALWERRRKILEYAFESMAPLDNPRVEDRRRVTLVDVAVLGGLAPSEGVEYRWSLRWHGPDGLLGLAASRTRRPSAHLGRVLDWLTANEGDAVAEDPFLTLSWWRRELGDRGWDGPRVDVRLRLLADGSIIPVGLDREVDPG